MSTYDNLFNDFMGQMQRDRAESELEQMQQLSEHFGVRLIGKLSNGNRQRSGRLAIMLTTNT